MNADSLTSCASGRLSKRWWIRYSQIANVVYNMLSALSGRVNEKVAVGRRESHFGNQHAWHTAITLLWLAVTGLDARFRFRRQCHSRGRNS